MIQCCHLNFFSPYWFAHFVKPSANVTFPAYVCRRASNSAPPFAHKVLRKRAPTAGAKHSRTWVRESRCGEGANALPHESRVRTASLIACSERIALSPEALRRLDSTERARGDGCVDACRGPRRHLAISPTTRIRLCRWLVLALLRELLLATVMRKSGPLLAHPELPREHACRRAPRRTSIRASRRGQRAQQGR